MVSMHAESAATVTQSRPTLLASDSESPIVMTIPSVEPGDESRDSDEAGMRNP